MTLKLYEQIAHKKARSFLYLNIGLIFFTLFVMLLGPLVRAEEAGLACPDWPLCKAKLIPEMSYKIFLEWLHRLTAVLLSIFFLFWLGLTFYDTKLRTSHGRLVLICLGLLILQIVLGALTITESLDAYVVNSHLLNAILFLSVLFYSWRKGLVLYAASHRPKPQGGGSVLKEYRFLRRLCAFILLLVFFQIFMGARVSTHNAGRVCNTFPACYYEASIGSDAKLKFVPQYFPPMQGDLEKHMSHRFTAYLLLAAVLCMAYIAVRKKWPMKILYPVWLLLILIAIQILIGAFSVIFGVPLMLTLLHSLFAYAVYLSALWLFLEAKFAASA